MSITFPLLLVPGLAMYAALWEFCPLMINIVSHAAAKILWLGDFILGLLDESSPLSNHYRKSAFKLFPSHHFLVDHSVLLIYSVFGLAFRRARDKVNLLS